MPVVVAAAASLGGWVCLLLAIMLSVGKCSCQGLAADGGQQFEAG